MTGATNGTETECVRTDAMPMDPAEAERLLAERNADSHEKGRIQSFAEFFGGRRRHTDRIELKRALAAGEFRGKKFSLCERICAEYAYEMSVRLGAMADAMHETTSQFGRLHRLAEDFRKYRDPAHLDQALEQLERKLDICDLKRREIMGVY